MARKFRMKDGLSGALSLPGMPGLRVGMVVEGDEYARFCPAVLEEVFEATPVVEPEAETRKVKPKAMTAPEPVPEPEPEPAPAPAPEPEPEPEPESEPAPKPKTKAGRKRR